MLLYIKKNLENKTKNVLKNGWCIRTQIVNLLIILFSFQTVKMLTVVVTAYSLCWLPLHVITIVGDVNPNIYDYTYVHTLWMFIHWLAISNSCTNPIIYFCMNNAFHQGFVLVCRGMVCRDYTGLLRRSSAQNTGSTRSNKPSNRNNNNEPLKLVFFSRYA